MTHSTGSKGLEIIGSLRLQQTIQQLHQVGRKLLKIRRYYHLTAASNQQT